MAGRPAGRHHLARHGPLTERFPRASPGVTAIIRSGRRCTAARRAAACSGRPRFRRARDRTPHAWKTLLRRPLQAHRLAVRLRRLGQEGMGLPRDPRRARRLDGRGRDESLLGRALRTRDRRRRSVGQAVRQLAHGVVQGSRHDGARVRGQADDRRRRARFARWPAPRRATRQRRSRRMRRPPGIPAIVILPSARVTPAQLVQPMANGALRALARHRLRRLHDDRPASRDGRRRLPRQLDEQPPARRAEDVVDRDRSAVRLGSPRRRHRSWRQPRQCERASAPGSR